MIHQASPLTYIEARFGTMNLVRTHLIRDLFYHATKPGTLLTHDQQNIAGRLSDRLNNCCSSPVIVVDDDDKCIRISEQRCKCRLCPLCGRARSRAVFIRILSLVRTFDAPKFVTLTPISNDLPLVTQIIELKKAFGRLRRSQSWQTYVIGGVYTLEVTFNRKRDQWHPHLHMVIDSHFYPHRELSAAWSIASNGAKIVDIRPCHSRRNVATYIAGYVSKSSDIAKFPPDRRVEWAIDTNGLRFVQTFGTAHKVKCESEDEYSDDDKTITVEILPPDELALAATLGDDDAKQLLAEVLKIERHRVSNAPPDQADQLASRIRNLVARLRAWRDLHKEGNDRGPLEFEIHSRRQHRSRDRPLRLWQEPSSPTRSW